MREMTIRDGVVRRNMRGMNRGKLDKRKERRGGKIKGVRGAQIGVR